MLFCSHVDGSVSSWERRRGAAAFSLSSIGRLSEPLGGDEGSSSSTLSSSSSSSSSSRLCALAAVVRPRLIPTARADASPSSVPPPWPSKGDETGEEDSEEEEGEAEDEAEALLLLAAAADGSVARWREPLLPPPPLLAETEKEERNKKPCYIKTTPLRLEVFARVSPSAPVTAVAAAKKSTSSAAVVALGTAAGRIHFVSASSRPSSSSSLLPLPVSLSVGSTVPAHSRPVRGLRWLSGGGEGEEEGSRLLSGIVVSWAGAPASAPAGNNAGNSSGAAASATEDAEISLVDFRTRTATRLPPPPRGGGSYDRGEGEEGEEEEAAAGDQRRSSSPSSPLPPPDDFFSSRAEERRQRMRRRAAPLLDIVAASARGGAKCSSRSSSAALLLVLLRGAPAELWSISPTLFSSPSPPFSASCLRLLDLPFAAAAWVESPLRDSTNRLAFALADGRVGALDVDGRSGAAAAAAAPRRPAWGLLGADAAPTALCCSGKPNLVLIGDADGGLHAWDTESGRVTTAAVAAARAAGGAGANDRGNDGRGGGGGGGRGAVRALQVLCPSPPSASPILVSVVFAGGTAGVWEVRSSPSAPPPPSSPLDDGPGFDIGGFGGDSPTSSSASASVSSPRPLPPVVLLPSSRLGNATVRLMAGGAPALGASWLRSGVLLVAAASGGGFAGACGSGVLALSCSDSDPSIETLELPPPPRTLGTALLLPGAARQLLRLLLARDAVAPELIRDLVAAAATSGGNEGGGEMEARKVLSAMPPLPEEQTASSSSSSSSSSPPSDLVAAIRSIATLRASGRLLHASEWKALFAAGCDPAARAAVAAAVSPPSTPASSPSAAGDDSSCSPSSAAFFWAFALPKALGGGGKGKFFLEPFGECPWTPESAVAAARERAEAFGAAAPSSSSSSSPSSSAASSSAAAAAAAAAPAAATATPLGGFAAPARGEELAALESLCLGDNATAVGLLLASAAPDAPAAERYRDALCAVAAAAAAAEARTSCSLGAGGGGGESDRGEPKRKRPPTSPLLVQAFKVAAANAAASGDALLGAYLMFAAGDAAEAAATLVAAGGNSNFSSGDGNDSKAAGAGWRLAVTLACSALSETGEGGDRDQGEEDRARLRTFLARWAAASLEKERGARWRGRGVLAAVGAWRQLMASLSSSPPPPDSFPSSSSSRPAPAHAFSSPDAAASLRRALRARGVGNGEEEGEGGGERNENDAACSRQWGDALSAAASAPFS